MKKKLDLNNLLAKYEGVSSNYHQTQYNYQEPTKEIPIEEEFYQYKTYQQEQRDPFPNAVETHQITSNKNFKGNFVMSKSEVEQFLLSIKEEIRNQHKSITFHAENAFKQIHQAFNRSHDKVKKQILDLLDRAFYENQRIIKQELQRQSKIEPAEFMGVYRKISTIEDDINRLLSNLKGNQYRKAIAEVVTRDFNVEIQELKTNIVTAKNNYINSLGDVEPDRSRIESIKDNLSKLFFINKKNTARNLPVEAPPQESGIFSLFKDRSQAPIEQAQTVPAVQRTRKSFFNFGGD